MNISVVVMLLVYMLGIALSIVFQNFFQSNSGMTTLTLSNSLAENILA